MEINYFRPSFPVDCTDSEIGLCIPPVPDNFAASLEWCGGASARPAGHRNRAARERRRNPGSGRRTGKSRNAIWAGRRRENRRGREWRELERTGRKEGEGRGRKLEETEEEAEEKRNRTGNGENQNRGRGTIPRRYAWKGEENEPGSGVRNEVERPTGTGRKEGEGTGRKRRETRVDKGGEIRGGSCIGTWREPDARKGKEAENAKGGETPLEREDERSGENRTQGRGGKRSATKGP